jgi:hypothetical protein
LLKFRLVFKKKYLFSRLLEFCFHISSEFEELESEFEESARKFVALAREWGLWVSGFAEFEWLEMYLEGVASANLEFVDSGEEMERELEKIEEFERLDAWMGELVECETIGNFAGAGVDFVKLGEESGGFEECEEESEEGFEGCEEEELEE